MNINATETQNFREKNNFFQNELLVHMNYRRQIILIGDFICVIRKRYSLNNAVLSKALIELVQKTGLTDVWEITHKNELGFFFYQGRYIEQKIIVIWCIGPKQKLYYLQQVIKRY